MQTVRALRAIPPVEYRSLSEVLSSVSLDDEQDVVSPGQQVPIVDELGTNRGS